MSSQQGIYILTSRLQSQIKKLDSAAVNVANVNAVGFKKQDVDFATVLGNYSQQNPTKFVTDHGFRTSFSQGVINQTNNPLDAAIVGDGFFAIQSAVTQGTTYTRNGQFTLSAQGLLVTQQGEAVLDDGNQQIQVPANAVLEITRDGGLIADGTQIAKLGIFQPPVDAPFIRIGSNQFTLLEGAALPVEKVTLVAGGTEASNVDPVLETIRLGEVSRAYQSAANLASQLEALEERVIRELPRQNN